MAQTPNRIFVPGRAYVYLGAVGSTAPTDPAVAPAAPMVEVGLFTADSLSFTTEPNFETVTSHQSDFPTRRMETATEAALNVDLQEWSEANFRSVYGGGTVTKISTDPAAAVYKFSPPALGSRTELMCVVKVADGAKESMLIIPRCMQVEGVEHNLAKAAESTLPLRLAILGSGIGDPYYWITSDPAFAPAP